MMKQLITIFRLVLVAAVAMTLCLTATAEAALQDGLVANWTFDDGAGATTVLDSVGGNNATLVSGTWDAGLLGGSLAFDGIVDGALVGDQPGLDLGTTAMTLATWVKLDALPADQPNSFGAIYDATEDAYVLYTDKGNNELRFKVTATDAAGNYKGAARPGIAASLLDTTGWHHVAGVFDGYSVSMFYDGQLVDMHGITGPGGQVKSGQVAGIGLQPGDPLAAPIVPDDGFFDGSVDDMAIWNRALSTAEIGHLYNAGTGNAVLASNPVLPPNPAAAAPALKLNFEGNLLNSGSGGAAYDGTMVGANGTMSYVAGVSGLAVDLAQDVQMGADGVHVEVDYTMPEEGTMTFRAKPGDFYNYLSVLDNSLNNANWEMWVYGDGRARFRINGNAYVTYNLNDLSGPNEWYDFAVTWKKGVDTDQVGLSMFIDGEHVSGDTGTWVAPGAKIGIGGGVNVGNPAGEIAFDDFRIYEEVLSTEEIRALAVPEPSTIALLISALALLIVRPITRKKA